MLFVMLSGENGSRAEELTASDKDFLLGVLPTGAEKASKSAELLIRCGDTLTLAADRISEKQSFSINRELVELGAALQLTSNWLKMLDPLLLKKESVSLWGVWKEDPSAGRAMTNNLKRTNAYQACVVNIGEIGRTLKLLDPLRDDGPSTDVAQSLKVSGQSLLDLDEQSGIGLYFKYAGSVMEWFRYAALRRNNSGCSAETRLLGQMIDLAGESLSGSTSIIWQSAAAKRLALSLFTMSNNLPTPSLNELQRSMDVYAKSTMQLVHSLERRSEILRTMNGPPELETVMTNFRNAAPAIAQQAAVPRAEAERVATAAKALRDYNETHQSRGNVGDILESAGTTLKGSNALSSVTETGEALAMSGRLLREKNPRPAADILKKAGLEIGQQERPLLRDE